MCTPRRLRVLLLLDPCTNVLRIAPVFIFVISPGDQLFFASFCNTALIAILVYSRPPIDVPMLQAVSVLNGDFEVCSLWSVVYLISRTRQV